MTALLLVLTALLIALNAFFVMGEYALVRSRRSRLEAMRDEGQRGAALALVEIDEIGDYISTVQVGITFTSIGIGALGEPVLAALFENWFGDAISHGLAIAISIVVAYVIITSAHIVAGELVPKLYAIDRAEGVARRVARPLRFFRRLFAPFIVVLTGISYRVLRRIGIDPTTVAEDAATTEDLKALIAQSGTLDPGEAGMLSGVFHLHEQEARQVMTPIPAVVTVDTSEDVETALRRCVSSGHTRLVVTEDENQDRVRGIVHSNSLARQL
ncbi:MAG: hemolysin family protein, partial [Gaiellaceae bacterium]